MKKRLLSLVAALVFAPAIAFAAASNPTNVQNGPTNQTEFHGSMVVDGGVTVNGSIIQNGLGAPAAPTITNGGTAGSTSYTYYCVAQDVNGNESPASASASTSTGNATLSATNTNIVQCGGTRGAVTYRVLKADTSHSLGTCNAANMGGYCTVTDNSTSAGTAYTANTQDQTIVGPSTINKCGGQVAVSAGAAVVTATCIGYSPASYAACSAVAAGAGSTPVASNVFTCRPTSTATVISAATVTVGAVQLLGAGTATATVNWWAGPL